MAKEKVSLCQEHHIYATEEERMCHNRMLLGYIDRLPILDPKLKWICPVQENFATIRNHDLYGRYISKRFWLVGIDKSGYAISIRSISITHLLSNAYGVVEEGAEAPVITAVLDESGKLTPSTLVSHIRAIDDISWIHDDGDVFSVISPIAIRRTGISKEVYYPKYKEGELIVQNNRVELTTGIMQSYTIVGVPSEEELKAAISALNRYVSFYGDVSVVGKDGVRINKDNKRLLKCPADFQGGYMIPDGITEIGDYAFSNCQGITSVTIPHSIKRIGAKAFYNCKGLTTIDIPNSVTNISADAFDECNPHVAEIADIYRTKLEKKIRQQREEEETARRLEAERARQEAAKRIAAEQERLRIIKARDAEEQRRMQEQQMQEMLQGSILFFDTETTGTPRNYKAPISDSYNWPRLVQLAWIMADKSGNILKKKSVIIRPSGFSIPEDAAAVHGISTEKAEREGVLLHDVLDEFETDLSFAEQIVGHNIDFDQHIVGAELYRLGMNSGILMDKPCICTMKSSTDFCAIPNPNPYFGGYKWPSLQELYSKLFGHEFSDAHDALADVSATKECYFELKRRGIIQ